MSVLAAVDLNWCLQFIVTVFLVAFGFLHLVKNTASKYFLAQDNDNDDDCDWSIRTPATGRNSSISSSSQMMTMTRSAADTCAVCGDRTKKKCSGCKMVMYCSENCQRSHWRSEHKLQCKDFRLSGKSVLGGTGASGGSSKFIHQSNKILFPYEKFVELFNWDKPGFPPCGLLNCGNSCFANVVLQCLSYTRPLIAFLLEKGHRRECRRNDWCFLCEFQTHVERASQSLRPFSPINILSRLPNIGGNLGYGKQEDAHEFMRFAIDTMQAVCLDEFGGEKAVHPSSQETTLIQHIFGGHLQSQVICTKCNNVSNQYENMMDLTVEIQGDAASLEECLDQFTAKEWLHGDNMYRCDGCNDYVMAWKRLSVRRAPNILTIALKRFQSGRFGKLNKRVTFPETLDLSPYISETGEEDNIYKLYAVIVHVDMLNASFFGHYICYIKDFRGKWYRIDDCKVNSVDIDEVLSQGAYMLLYSRIHARSSCSYPIELPREENDNMEVEKEVEPSSEHPVQYYFAGKSTDTLVNSVVLPSDNTSKSEVARCEVGSSKDGEFCDLPGAVTAEVAAAHLEHAHRLLSGNNASNTRDSTEVDVPQIKPSSPQSNAEDETGYSKSIPLEYSLRRLSNQDSVAAQNNVYEREELEHFSEDTSEVASCKIGLSLTSNSENAEDVEMVDLEEHVPVSMDDELYKLQGCVAVEEAAVSCDSCSLVLRNDAFTEADVVKMKPPSLSNVKDGIVGGKNIPQGCLLMHSLDHDSMATQNHVYERGETPVHISADMLIANELLEQTVAANSKDKIGTAGCEVPSSNHVQNPAKKVDGKRCGAKVKPLFPPGFLEKRPQKKYIKHDDRVSAELVGLLSGSTVNCQKNGVARPDLSCQMGAAMTNGDGEHFACHDNGCGNTLGMCEMDTRMTASEFNKPSGFDEPSLVNNGNTRKPIISDDSSSVDNTDDRMLVEEQNPVINNRFYG